MSNDDDAHLVETQLASEVAFAASSSRCAATR